jgi:hypothetical protein
MLLEGTRHPALMMFVLTLMRPGEPSSLPELLPQVIGKLSIIFGFVP